MKTMLCFPEWLVWTMLVAFVLAGVQLGVLAFMGFTGRLVGPPPKEGGEN